MYTWREAGNAKSKFWVEENTMNHDDKKQTRELTADDLEQVVGGASTGPAAPILKLAPVSTPPSGGDGTTSIIHPKES
jgi:hypothetical protein